MKEIKADTINFYNATQVVEQLKSINSTRALSRWSKVIEDSTSYIFKRKANNSRIYTEKDLEKFLSVDNAYSKAPDSSIDDILIAQFSLINDLAEQETTSMPLDAQVLKTLVYQNEQLFKQNELLAESLSKVQNELNDLKDLVIDSNQQLLETKEKKRKGFLGFFRK